MAILQICRRIIVSPMSQFQVRGARTMTKAEMEDLQGIPVRLLKNVPGFGRKDAIIRVKAGRMRNVFHHKGMAEYMTKDRFAELGLTTAAIGVRDRSFGKYNLPGGKKSNKNIKKKTTTTIEPEPRLDFSSEETLPAFPVVEKKKKPESLVLAPAASHALLTKLVPNVLTFTRKPIPAPAPLVIEQKQPEPESEPEIRRSPSLAARAATSLKSEPEPTPAPAPEPEKKAEKKEVTAIFGSVSTTDILALVREHLAVDRDGSRVALSPEHVTIIGLKEGEDRIKHLGRYQVDIDVSKDLKSIRRTIEVVAEEES